MISERVKEIRKSIKLSQTDFGKRLGVSRDVINNIENGRVEPSEVILKLISKDFGISMDWLKRGQGEMMISPEEDLASLAGNLVLGAMDDSFRRRFLTMLAGLGDAEWELLRNMAHQLADSQNEKREE